ncbi:MAG: TetR/AcrR family transcriptional regulator [Thermoleophilaceae bacterium]
MVTAGAELFRRQGYAATGVKEIVTAASAPFGSMYHHFPGGKEELGAEAVRSSGALYGLLVEVVLDPAPDLVTGVREFYRLAGVNLEETAWTDACPIATVALEVSSTSEPMREACAEVFEGWLQAAIPRFVDHGIAPGRARELAVALVCQLEGAFVLARAMRTTELLDVAGELMAGVVERELAAS